MMELNALLVGAAAFGYAAAGLFFLRFFRRTRDALFVSFALAFGLLAIGEIPSAWIGPGDATQIWYFLIRLAAFSLIIAAIVRKNLR